MKVMAFSYFISVTTQQMNAEIILAILNIAGRGQSVYGFSNGTITTDLWIIPKGNRNRQEVITQLQAVPGIQSVSIVALSNPINEKELLEVRELFTQIGWDARSITDEKLLLYINSKLQGQYRFYIDHAHTEHTKNNPAKINIRPIEEHPAFTPEWLQSTARSNSDLQDRMLTIDDIEVESIIIETTEEEIEPPPPPKQ